MLILTVSSPVLAVCTTYCIIGKVIQKNQLDATMIY